MKMYFIIIMSLLSVTISFSQNLLSETEIKIQRFGKDVIHKDKNDNLLNGHYKIADSRGNYSEAFFKEGRKDGKSVDYDFKGRVLKTTELNKMENGKPLITKELP